MRARVLVGAAAAAIAITGIPAQAACIGCGGAVAPGAAALELSGTGSYTRHSLDSKCSYSSAPNNGTYTGSLSASATASIIPTEPVVTQVTCSLVTKGGHTYTVQDDGREHSAAGIQVPPLQEVERLCLNASATWTMSSTTADSASVARCVTPGVAVAVLGEDWTVIGQG